MPKNDLRTTGPEKTKQEDVKKLQETQRNHNERK